MGFSSDRVFRSLASLIVIFSCLAPNAPARAQAIDDLQRSFERPPDDAKIMMRWWWFGPAITKSELEREMRLMKEGGIGGFEVQPVYPLTLEDGANGVKILPFLSDEFIEMLRFTSVKARELGLRMDLTLGSGWPFGGPMVNIDQAAGQLRYERVKIGDTRRVPLPNLSAGEKFIGAFLIRTRGKDIGPEGVRELTDIKDNAVWIPANLDESYEVMFFISGRAGMQVKRPAVGGEGFVLNHMDRPSTEHYLRTTGDRLMKAFSPGNPPYAVFCDSLEVYNQDWTSDFLEEFRRRRGYDLKPYLPALIANMGPKTSSIRHDWGRTQTELLNERFFAPMQEWSRRNGTRFRIQGYGIPAATISSNAGVDLTEGEGPQWKVVRASRWASSANHIYDRNVTSSETWTWLHSPVFRATPLDIKAEADLHFLQGINQLIGHGWPYTPEGVEYPGWRFYAAGVYNEKNPWWIVMPDLALYLQRISFLMRQGRPANDVALYLPNSDAWASFSAGKVHMIETLREHLGPAIMPAILEAGYNLDFFDDDALDRVGRVEKGALLLGPNRYQIVILPGVEHIPPSTLRKLEAFARGGGVLVATRRIPGLAPGLQATEAEQNQIRELSRNLFESTSAPAHFVTEESNQLAQKLKSLFQPDVELSPSVPEIGFIHRRSNEAEIYFLANTSNLPHSVKATFRVQGLQPESWDPITGRIWAAKVEARPKGGTALTLDLAPYESRVIVFSKRMISAPPAPSATLVMTPLDLSSDWRVSFGRDGKVETMDRLRSWTENEETRYFSGEATYERVLSVPEIMLNPGVTVRLDLGTGNPVPVQPIKAGMQTWFDAPVREAAVVYINDRRAGSLWCPPYSLDVTGLLRRGENRIRIVVGNLALNYMAGRRLPDYRLLNLRYGERFQAQDMDKVKAEPAGLLGPIRLTATGKDSGP